jgi:hypothetical protein
MPHGMTKIATTTRTTTTTPQEEEPSVSFYSSRRLKLYTPAEIEQCENSKTIMKYINAKTIQAKNTGISYKTRLQSFAQFVYRRYNKHLLTTFWSRLKVESMTHTIF